MTDKPVRLRKPGKKPVNPAAKPAPDPSNLRQEVAVSFSISEPEEGDTMIGAPVAQIGPDRPAVLVKPLRKWCFQADIPIFSSTDLSSLTPTVRKLSLGTIVTVLRQHVFPGDESLWSEISYTAYDKTLNRDIWTPVPVTGWVNDLFLDLYVEPFPEDDGAAGVLIPHPTPNPFDAQQYLTLPDDTGFADRVRYNMCGELCVAYLMQDDIETVLKNWKNKPGSAYGSIVAAGRNETTSQGNLADLLRANLPLHGFGADDDQVVNFVSRLTIPVSLDRMRIDFEKTLVTHALIVLVTIDHLTGALIDKSKPGTMHWVVVNRLNGTHLEIYNPFPNKREEYAFGEFYASCVSGWQGLWVKRKSGTGFIAASPAARPFQVQLDVPRPANLLAEQYITREGGIKHELCGEFSTAYILGKSVDGAVEAWRQTPPQSIRELTVILKAYGYSNNPAQTRSFTIGTVLDFWREKQPELYKAHVAGDKPTGTLELRTILKAYGYVNDGDLVDLRAGLTDKKTGLYLPSPGRMAEKLKTHFLIAGVGIEGVHGRLVFDGPIRHWVVVETIRPNARHYIDPNGRLAPVHYGGGGGWVELYNPFTNVIEEYSMLEFTNSMSPTGNWYGMWVKRQVQPVFMPQDVVTPVPDDEPAKTDKKAKDDAPVKRWSDQRMKDEIQKRLKNNVPPDRILASLVKDGDTGWRSDQIAALLPAQPKQDPGVDIEKTLLASQSVKALQPEIVTWVKNTSRSSPSLAVDITRTMRETGILVVEEQAGLGKLAETGDAALRAALDSHTDSLSAASRITRKVAGVIAPVFTARVTREIAALRGQNA